METRKVKKDEIMTKEREKRAEKCSIWKCVFALTTANIRRYTAKKNKSRRFAQLIRRHSTKRDETHDSISFNFSRFPSFSFCSAQNTYVCTTYSAEWFAKKKQGIYWQELLTSFYGKQRNISRAFIACDMRARFPFIHFVIKWFCCRRKYSIWWTIRKLYFHIIFNCRTHHKHTFQVSTFSWQLSISIDNHLNYFSNFNNNYFWLGTFHFTVES